MKVDEKQLVEVLRLAINDANNNKKSFIDLIKSLMFNMYGVTGGEVVDILNGKIPLETMPKETMFKITSALYEANKHVDGTFDQLKLDVDVYFTDREKAECAIRINKDDTDKDIVIQNWLQVADDQYIIVISNDELLQYVDANKVRYNPETQRDLTIKDTKSGKIKMITYFPDSLKNIFEAMENNLYISDALTFNVNPDYYMPPKISRDKLVIPKDSVMDCIDGFHRLTDAVLVKRKHPEWNQNFIINLMVYDKNKAVQYILQEDKKNHLSDAQTTKADDTDAANFIIDKLNRSTRFIFRNTINDDMVYVLNKLINEIFAPKKLLNSDTRQEAVALYNLIENNINELIEQNNTGEKELSKEKWFIYLYTLKYCSDNNLDFVETISDINMDYLLDNIKFINKPSKKHYKTIQEVINNV